MSGLLHYPLGIVCLPACLSYSQRALAGVNKECRKSYLAAHSGEPCFENAHYKGMADYYLIAPLSRMSLLPHILLALLPVESMN